MDEFDLIPKLIRSGLEDDKKTFEAAALMIAKKMKKTRPELASEIAGALAYSRAGSPVSRSLGLAVLPVDNESRMSLLNVEEPAPTDEPVLEDLIKGQIVNFIDEWQKRSLFFEEGMQPPNKLLLVGPPGVGKTYIAHWVSYKLGLPLVGLDLASSISSYLGKSGQNLKKIFDYAKNGNTILFLDEMDAIAKRRDDAADLGELKRLVNVLLVELESCPANSVVIGATNHPELLDKAVWRRFDLTLNIPMPELQQREQLFARYLDKYIEKLDAETCSFLAKSTKDQSAADIARICQHIKRRLIMAPDESAKLTALSELCRQSVIRGRSEKVTICAELRAFLPKLTLRDISSITNIPLATVSRYLSNKTGGGKHD